MNRCSQTMRLLLMLAVGAGSVALPIVAQEVVPPPAPLPVAPYPKNEKGLIVAEVNFAADGKVKSCRVVRSNAPFPLEAATVEAIKRVWNDRWLAGETVDFPITFDELPWYATHWDDDLVPPPNILPPGDPGRKLKLRISFGADGWVERVEVVQHSGIELVDRQTAIWVEVHWHNDAFAGRTLDTPFEFKPPLTPRPAMKKPPASAPQPAAPAYPATAPAGRAE